MAKTRMLKTDLRWSEKVASWPIPVRYFWVLLWGYLDDYGKAKDNPLLVKADCFPLDPDVTPELLDEWLWVMAESGVIVRYVAEGTNFMAAVNWSEHQKPQHPVASKIPDPDGNEIRMRTSCAPHEPLTPGFELGLVKSGIGYGSSPAVMDSKPDYAAEFEEAWAHWPKKVERKAAYTAYLKAIKKVRWDFLLDAIQRFGAAYVAAGVEKQFIPGLAPWLNGERWTDDLPVPARPATAAQRNLATVDYFAQQQQLEVEP